MRIGKRHFVLLALVCLAMGVFVLAVSAAAKEKADKGKAVSLEKTPQAVRAALEAKLSGATNVQLTQESDDGFTAYEAEYTANALKQSLTVAEDGSIMETEQDVATASLPQAVSAQIQRRFPKVQIKKAQQVVSTYYEVKLDVAGKEREIRIHANGQPVEDED